MELFSEVIKGFGSSSPSVRLYSIDEQSRAKNFLVNYSAILTYFNNVFHRRSKMIGLAIFFVGALLASSATGDPLEKCVARNNTYRIGDHEQCDKYWECGKSEKLTERLCDDGFVFSLKISQCDYPHNVDCGERTILQPSKSTNPLCPRTNGFYAFPPEISCQKFYHCLQGEAYEKTCPEGVIFDGLGTCVHPDLSYREECSAQKVLDFTCPNAGQRFSKLKFGNHDRHPHPTDCRKFFVCMQDGQPRIGGCPIGKVFNPKLGVCDAPKRVPNCEDYYGKKGVPKKGDESLEGLEDESADNDESDEEAIQQVVKNQKLSSKTKRAEEDANEEKDL